MLTALLTLALAFAAEPTTYTDNEIVPYTMQENPHPTWARYQYLDSTTPYALTDTFGFGSGHMHLSMQGKQQGLTRQDMVWLNTVGNGFLFVEATSVAGAALSGFAIKELADDGDFIGAPAATLGISITTFVVSRIAEKISLGKARQRLNKQIVDRKQYEYRMGSK